jgi:DNA polymerase I-like protein with 3'-5' exonuclease and polymerase domains
MARYFFDIETDGLLDDLTKVHSLVLIDADTGEMRSSRNDGHPDNLHRMNEGFLELSLASEIIGHNIIKFDIPAIQKVYPWFRPRGKVTDTLTLSRLLFADMYDHDEARIRVPQYRDFPKKMMGSHSLKAWGYRLGILKGDFGAETDWAEWSPEMQSYCEQDVRVTEKLYARLMRENPSAMSFDLEHRFATIMAMQERHGFTFDEAGASALYASLVQRRHALHKELIAAFPPKVVVTTFIPKVNNKTRGYIKGFPVEKRDIVHFNPSSRQMIADRLKALGWEPQEFTPSGQAKVDETILSKLPYPEAALLAQHFLIEKRIGQLAEGDQAWLKLVRKGRIHGSINTNGAVTGRCTHSQPNVAQVPSVKVDKEKNVLWGLDGGYGAECRSLFTVRPGYSLVGADLSGLELRCLAHFMAAYDDGKYGDILLNGDIHTVNQLAAGLPTRNDAKTFIYAFLYGAGDAKIGSIVAPLADEKDQARLGKSLKAKFLNATPAIKDLRIAVRDAARTRGYLKGLDGRKLRVRSEHSALNTLLQSAGALIAKLATVIAYDNLTASGLKWGKDFAFVAHVHDEVQVEVRQGLEQRVGEALVEAMREAGRVFKFKIPIDGEFKIGRNWKETH